MGWRLVPSIAALAAPFALATEPAPAARDAERARRAFLDVARVLQSPRCMNCHPAGDAPLRGDDARPHAMNVRRAIEKLGMRCGSCHPLSNLAGAPMPPGAPNWHLPPEVTPMVFQGKSPAELCRSLKDPKQNGNKSLGELLHHVRDDELVKWGWSPGEGRTVPPLPHAEFVGRFAEWIAHGAACPQ